jgi:hypothetical protein
MKKTCPICTLEFEFKKGIVRKYCSTNCSAWAVRGKQVRNPKFGSIKYGGK